MYFKHYKTMLLIAGFAAIVMLSTSWATALVDLEWRPSRQTVLSGEVVHIDLYAVSDDGSDQSISAMDVIINWDPAHLQLIGVDNNGPYDWLFSGFSNDSGLDGINDTWLDGDALYSAYSQLGQPALATPAGLAVTTFQFEAIDEVSLTEVTIPENAGLYSHTQIFDGDTPGLDIHGDLGAAMVSIGAYGTVIASMICLPASGTLPFTTSVTVTLINNESLRPGTAFAAHIDLVSGNGNHYDNWKSGSKNIARGGSYRLIWQQNIPAQVGFIGGNVFTLVTEDVTPSPFNQPPYPPSGDTDTDTCTVTGIAP